MLCLTSYCHITELNQKIQHQKNDIYDSLQLLIGKTKN